MYLWVAPDPGIRAVYRLALTEVRNILVAWSFCRALRRKYGTYPSLMITDADIWYRWSLQRLDIRHEVLSGDVRSYVERSNETLKDRSRPFDKYQPCCKEGCDLVHVLNRAYLATFWYNHARRHQSLGMRLPSEAPSTDCSCWKIFVHRPVDVLS